MKKHDVIIACDFPDAQQTLDFLRQFQQEKPFVKIGMELFYGEGPDIVRQIKSMGHDVFLDLKLHDIPNTVNKAMRNLARLGVNMTNVHAAGTADMMRAAKEGLAEGAAGEVPLLIAVTQLTSTTEERMHKELLIGASIEDTVRHYAKNACDSGLDGVVCSPLEAGIVKEQGLAENIRKHYPDCEVVAGTSTAGIAHAALVANILGLPMCYVRSSAKDHGRNNQIEGKVEKGQKVVVVEDLISTGGSVIEVVNVLREAGAQVLGIASIFTYGLQKGIDRMNDAQVKNVSLSNYDALVEVALEQNYIQPDDVKKLQAFRQNPSDAGWMNL